MFVVRVCLVYRVGKVIPGKLKTVDPKADMNDANTRFYTIGDGGKSHRISFLDENVWAIDDH